MLDLAVEQMEAGRTYLDQAVVADGGGISLKVLLETNKVRVRADARSGG